MIMWWPLQNVDVIVRAVSQPNKRMRKSTMKISPNYEMTIIFISMRRFGWSRSNLHHLHSGRGKWRECTREVEGGCAGNMPRSWWHHRAGHLLNNTQKLVNNIRTQKLESSIRTQILVSIIHTQKLVSSIRTQILVNIIRTQKLASSIRTQQPWKQLLASALFSLKKRSSHISISLS